MELYYISYERIVYRIDAIWYYYMIVVFRETIDNNSVLGLNTMEQVRTLKYGRINDEIDKIRIEYGNELELIDGRLGTGVCVVYDSVKWYVMKV